MTTVGQESGTSCLKKQQHWFADNINEMQSIIDKNKDANQKTIENEAARAEFAEARSLMQQMIRNLKH